MCTSFTRFTAGISAGLNSKENNGLGNKVVVLVSTPLKDRTPASQ
jgi:hypothetical protein